MRIEVVSVSARQPDWVRSGFDEYARRLTAGYSLTLRELPLARRGSSTPVVRAIEQEGERLLAAAAGADHLVALDEGGAAWTTVDLAARLEAWTRTGSSVALLIGGPDGLSPACLTAARERWSLSALTLPHGLVRILVAEALYRALSLSRGHPYHRA